jgi:hypothetical protein
MQTGEVELSQIATSSDQIVTRKNAQLLRMAKQSRVVLVRTWRSKWRPWPIPEIVTAMDGGNAGNAGAIASLLHF